MVAETATEQWRTSDLYDLVRRAHHYRDLSRDVFDEVVGLVSKGVATGRGTRAAYVHHDAVNGELRGRKGARLAALTSGGAIPELGDLRVVLEPDETFIGTVNEDWATESMAGDIFLLGTHSWQIRQIVGGQVRVVDADGKPPTIPFWFGEAPARTVELSAEVSALRAEVDRFLVAADPEGAKSFLADTAGVGPDAAGTVVDYLAAGRAALGLLPTQDHLVLERFFDDSGGMQLVVHSPWGGRINRAMGYALRKKFCRSFNFELQASANDDTVVISLGPHHSFALSDVPRFLNEANIADTLTQAVLDQPIFLSRWRWNLNRSLIVLRFKGGRRNPPPIQRMEADDLMAALFPGAAACQENITGPSRSPTTPWSARPSTTPSPKASTSTACVSCGAASTRAQSSSTSAIPPNRRCSPTRSSPHGHMHSSTKARHRIVVPTRCRCRGGSRSIRRSSLACSPLRSTRCAKRSHRAHPSPTSCTTCSRCWCSRRPVPTGSRCSLSSSIATGSCVSPRVRTCPNGGTPPRRVMQCVL
ncbi:MAG: hypothetical protein M5U19_22100 [Microthrixaceae bacterium]|nr:hypothetical protein [Microthrixaceae bacterium]